METEIMIPEKDWVPECPSSGLRFKNPWPIFFADKTSTKHLLTFMTFSISEDQSDELTSNGV
jgi:hypothetical protein